MVFSALSTLDNFYRFRYDDIGDTYQIHAQEIGGIFPMIKNIIFDVGMVLVDFHWEQTMRELGIPETVIHDLDKRMIHHNLWKELDLANIPEEDIVSEFKAQNPQYADYIDLFFQNLDEVVTTFDGTAEFIQELKGKGYKIYLLSNYPARMWKMHIPRFLFYPYVDGEVVSYQYHLSKPDRRIYETLCAKYQLNPQECIFLDDRQENIDTAKALGFEGIVVTDPFHARDELLKVL